MSTREKFLIDLLYSRAKSVPSGHIWMVKLTTRRARSAAERLWPDAHHSGATSGRDGDVAACVNGAAPADGRFRRRRVCLQV